MSLVTRILIFALLAFAFKQFYRIVFTPNEQYVNLIKAAYNELNERSVENILPKNSPFLEFCEKPDPNTILCG